MNENEQPRYRRYSNPLSNIVDNVTSRPEFKQKINRGQRITNTEILNMYRNKPQRNTSYNYIPMDAPPTVAFPHPLTPPSTPLPPSRLNLSPEFHDPSPNDPTPLDIHEIVGDTPYNLKVPPSMRPPVSHFFAPQTEKYKEKLRANTFGRRLNAREKYEAELASHGEGWEPAEVSTLSPRSKPPGLPMPSWYYNLKRKGHIGNFRRTIRSKKPNTPKAWKGGKTKKQKKAKASRR